MAASLLNFLQNYTAGWQNSGDLSGIDYTRLSIDSRTISAGDLFLALTGDRYDGHDFVRSAADNGAAAVVIAKNRFAEFARDLAVPVLAVEDPLNFLQQLAGWHRRRFSIPVLAITGSAGKTTTRRMICDVLAGHFQAACSEGNQNNHIGVPLSLLKISERTAVGVFELGSNHPGEIPRLAEGVQPTLGLVTNIGKGHLGNFGGMEAVYREKISLLEAIPAGGQLFINAEDPRLKKYQRDDVTCLRVGLTPRCDVFAESIQMVRTGCFHYLLQGREAVTLQVPGRHQIMNSLLAAAVGIHFGLELSDIGRALSSFRAEKQRMRIIEKNGVVVIDDSYNASPDSTAAAIRFLNELPAGDGRKIFVFGDMLELGTFSTAEHRSVGEQLSETDIDIILLYGEETRATLEAFIGRGGSPKKCRHYDTHSSLAKALREMLKSGDRLLIKGSRGMKMETVLNHLMPEQKNAG